MGLLSWMRGTAGPSGTALSAGLSELDAFFSPAKRQQLEDLHSLEMLADDEASGAPPRVVNLDEGTAVIRLQKAVERHEDGSEPPTHIP